MKLKKMISGFLATALVLGGGTTAYITYAHGTTNNEQQPVQIEESEKQIEIQDQNAKRAANIPNQQMPVENQQGVNVDVEEMEQYMNQQGVNVDVEEMQQYMAEQGMDIDEMDQYMNAENIEAMNEYMNNQEVNTDQMQQYMSNQANNFQGNQQMRQGRSMNNNQSRIGNGMGR